MKRTIALLAITLALAPTPVLLASLDGPYISHVGDTRPGYTMVASGDGYDPETVQVVDRSPQTRTMPPGPRGP
jgi:hypothetical protein